MTDNGNRHLAKSQPLQFLVALNASRHAPVLSLRVGCISGRLSLQNALCGLTKSIAN